MIERLKEFLKDKLPYRITLSKTPRGSTLYLHYSQEGNTFVGYFDFIPSAEHLEHSLSFFHIMLETAYDDGIITREVSTHPIVEPLELSDFVNPFIESLKRYSMRDERVLSLFPELKVLL